MKLPKTIICATGEVTLAIANYLKHQCGVTLDVNLDRGTLNPSKDRFFEEGMENEIGIYSNPSTGNKTATWNLQRISSGDGIKTLREFIALINAPSWKIGCSTIEARGNHLLILEDMIKVPKSVLEEMLSALK